MDNQNSLNLLGESWSKQRLIQKIKKGQTSEEIVQEFISENKNDLEIAINLLNQTDNNILSYMEAIATCEISLINKLREKGKKSNSVITNEIKEVNPIIKILKEFQLSLFMKKWSNQFVIGILIMISILSLTKQAWA